MLKADAKHNFKLKELDTVVVKGTAHRGEHENLTVVATGIYVRQ